MLTWHLDAYFKSKSMSESNNNIYTFVKYFYFNLDSTRQRIHGYTCTPHERLSNRLVDEWKRSDNISFIYFVTATFSSETSPYFPNKANHYILSSFCDMQIAISDIKKHSREGLSFIFLLNGALFERATEKLNYISVYFTKYTYSNSEICDLANAIYKRDRVRKASVMDIKFVATSQMKFIFPYSRNAIVLEVEGENTHQSDQRYCERTRREVARRGIPLTNMVSFSILDKLK